MSDNTAINRPWTVLPIISALIIALLVFYKGSWWLWFALASWVVLTVVAILALSEDKSREFQSATLKHSNYTQIYKVLVGRSHDQLWAAYCDPVDRGAGLPAMFRAALTWRLYDRALLLAVIYPVLLPVLWWLVTGQAAQLGPVVFLEPTGFRDVWPERAAILGSISLVLLNQRTEIIERRLPKSFWKNIFHWLGPVTVASVFALIGAGTLAVSIVIVSSLALAAFSSPLLAGSFTLAIATGITFTVSVSLEGAVGSISAVALSIALVVAAVGFQFLGLDGRPRFSRLLISLFTIGLCIVLSLSLTWHSSGVTTQTLFIFLGVLPLINAIFDVVSYAVTLSFIRRGRESRLPVLYGLADLGLALILFVALGVTMVAVIAGLNGLAGTDILDLGALLRDVRDQPGSYWWLYGIAFSTILPTALHAALALLGVQGLWPKSLRRIVAGWIGNARASQIDATRGAFALGLLWAVPVWMIVAAGWAAWHWGGTLATTLAGQYLALLERIAASLGAG